jgi:hypothetical protein
MVAALALTLFLFPTAGAARETIVSYVPLGRLQSICRGPAYGCAFWRDRRKPCHIYLPLTGPGLPGHPPITPAENERTLTHEIAHCEHGAFHPE